MKRPTPLPAPPPASTGGAGAGARSHGAPTAVDELDPPPRFGADLGGTLQRTAPVLPTAPLTVSALGDSRPQPVPLTGTAEPQAEPGEQRVGLRDVWRAARIRRRTLRAEVRRFTGRARRRRLVWAVSLGSVVVLALFTLGAAYSPLLGVEKITVAGASTVDAKAVAAALDDQLGKPLPLVDESAVKAALVAFPLIESYSLQARPPHELVVRIVERTPVGVVTSPAGYTLVDAAGVALATTPRKPAGQPVISVDGGTQTPAFEAVGQVVRSLPEAIRAEVTAVRASSPDDVTLVLGDTGTTIVWGGAQQSAMKALVLETVMRTKPPSKVKVYDVSSPEAIVLR